MTQRQPLHTMAHKLWAQHGIMHDAVRFGREIHGTLSHKVYTIIVWDIWLHFGAAAMYHSPPSSAWLWVSPVVPCALCQAPSLPRAGCQCWSSAVAADWGARGWG